MLRSIVSILWMFLSCSSAFVSIGILVTSRTTTKISRPTKPFTLQASDSPNEDNSVFVALTDQDNGPLKEALQSHSMLSILGVDLQLKDVSLDEPFPTDLLEDMDAACFSTSAAVTGWLKNLDQLLGIEDMNDDEKRSMGCGGVIAICINTATARTALETGRWEARKIYYPKGDEDGTSVDSWADMGMQGIGDVMERKFWGGDW